MRLLFWTIASLVQLTTGDLTEDEGLRKACEQMNGHYTARNPRNAEAPEGDVCQMKFSTGTRTEQEARELCSIYAPWRLQSAVDGLPTVCTVEATLMCEPGWIQMFGQCFRMPDKKKMKTRAEAEAECSSIKGKIAYLHHKYIVGIWKNYFRGVRRIWVRASEAYDHVIQHGKDTDGSLALAFNGIASEFTVPHNSLVKVPKDSRMQVLCEYQPEITNAEINYKAKKYDKMYYPSYNMGAGRVIRTTKHYHGNDWHPVEICVRPLKAFDMKPKKPFRMIKSALNVIRSEGSSFTRSGEEATFIRTSGAECQVKKLYFKMPIRSNGLEMGKNLNANCDNLVSRLIRHRVDSKQPIMQVAPAALGAPVWCRVGEGKQHGFVHPSADWTSVERNSRGYGYHLMGPATWDEAKSTCWRRWGAHLAGANTLDELKGMQEYIKSEGVDNQNVWLGGRRKVPLCDRETQFNWDHNDPCSRRNVFEWIDNAAENGFRDEWWSTDYTGRQNPSNKAQQCLALIVGNNNAIDLTKVGVLDDDYCHERRYFLCGKYLQPEVS